MAEVLLFHHARGMTDGFQAFARRLRDAGHVVHTPDLFDGRVFTTVDAGVDHARQIGFGALLDTGVRAADGLATDLVYGGISLGAMPAQQLAQTRAGARGAVLLEACLPADEFGDGWPSDVPVQVHGMDADPFIAGEGDLDAARALVAAADDGALHLYPGDGHLFTDSSGTAYDAVATDLLIERLLAFLARV